MADRATEDFLANLHDCFAKHLRDKLKNPDEVTSADLGVIRQFLKDNNITAIPTKDNPLGDMLGELQKLDFSESDSLN